MNKKLNSAVIFIVLSITFICSCSEERVNDASDRDSGGLYAVDPIVGNMRLIKSGSFVQGSSDEEPCRDSDEKPFRHTLTRTIAVMETEVTRQMWADLKAVQSSLPPDPTDINYGAGMNNPVQNVTWYEVLLFANLLSLQNGLTRCYYENSLFTIPIDETNYTSYSYYCNFDANGYRLLSEGEWEHAARARTSTPFSCNETNYTSETCISCVSGRYPTLEQYAVFCANSHGHSEAVGSKSANPWNLRDMYGNVWEWCWDRYLSDYPSDATDYTGPDSFTPVVRVVRGGGWRSHAGYCRSANRYSDNPSDRNILIGFRLARTVD